jgi:hypothetical protein
MEWEFLPEAVCIDFIRASIKANCQRDENRAAANAL